MSSYYYLPLNNIIIHKIIFVHHYTIKIEHSYFDIYIHFRDTLSILHYTKFLTVLGDHQDFIEVVQFLRNNPQALPFIYKEFPLQAAGEAQDLMEKGEHVGKIVLNIQENVQSE